MNVRKDEVFQTITQDSIHQFQAKRYDALASAGVEALILEFIVLEGGGGPCPHCKTPWKKIVVKNAFADYEYFQPACDCYQKCKRCGMSLYGVTFPNRYDKKYHCPRCGFTGEEVWRLTCGVCGINGTWHHGKYYSYICPECSSKRKKSKRQAMEVE